MPDPLSSPEVYQTFIYNLSEHSPSIRRSTLVYVPSGDLADPGPHRRPAESTGQRRNRDQDQVARPPARSCAARTLTDLRRRKSSR